MRTKVLVLLAAILFIKCSGVEVGSHEITKEQNNKLVNLPPGTYFSVKLPGNPTTGYCWKTASIDTAMIYPSGSYEYKASSDLMGASGLFTLRFKALKTGSSFLKFYYLRIWEKGITPIDSFKVNINVN
jgi:inhibitor of cysteine peptidase